MRRWMDLIEALPTAYVLFMLLAVFLLFGGTVQAQVPGYYLDEPPETTVRFTFDHAESATYTTQIPIPEGATIAQIYIRSGTATIYDSTPTVSGSMAGATYTIQLSLTSSEIRSASLVKDVSEVAIYNLVSPLVMGASTSIWYRIPTIERYGNYIIPLGAAAWITIAAHYADSVDRTVFIRFRKGVSAADPPTTERRHLSFGWPPGVRGKNCFGRRLI